MDLSEFFASVLEIDSAPVVICNCEHTVVYMNPASKKRYHTDLTGKDIRLCHNAQSNEKIESVLYWFKENTQNNCVHTYHSKKENTDVYMIALRDTKGRLIGYYEKHESRTPDNTGIYVME